MVFKKSILSIRCIFVNYYFLMDFKNSLVSVQQSPRALISGISVIMSNQRYQHWLHRFHRLRRLKSSTSAFGILINLISARASVQFGNHRFHISCLLKSGHASKKKYNSWKRDNKEKNCGQDTLKRHIEILPCWISSHFRRPMDAGLHSIGSL